MTFVRSTMTSIISLYSLGLENEFYVEIIKHRTVCTAGEDQDGCRRCFNCMHHIASIRLGRKS